MSDVQLRVELRKWGCRHVGQSCTGKARAISDNSELTFQATLATDTDGNVTLLFSDGTSVVFPDPAYDYAEVTAHPGAGKNLSTFNSGAASLATRPSTPTNVPSVSPAPTNPAPQQFAAQSAPYTALPGPASQPQWNSDLAQLAQLVAQVVNIQQQQQSAMATLVSTSQQSLQQQHQLAQSLSASLSTPRPSPGAVSTASSVPSTHDAAVLQHLAEVEADKEKFFRSKAITRAQRAMFTAEELEILRALPVELCFHKDEQYFADYVYATQQIAGWIQKHLYQCLQPTAQLSGDRVLALFSEALKRERTFMNIERGARVRSLCWLLDTTMQSRTTTNSNAIAHSLQEIFLDLGVLSLLLDGELALSHERITLATISAIPSSKECAKEWLSGSKVRTSKVLSSLPVKKGAGKAGF